MGWIREMRITIKQINGEIESAISSESLFQHKDPQMAFREQKEFEDRYKQLIQKGSKIVKKIDNTRNNLQLRWKLGELLNQFLIDKPH